ncbi:MAG: glucose-6-phosphate isomerase [Nitrospirae bacterium]|nr:glucose-6-phosphate isomerase [Nitrospirota bacterium]
MMADAIGDLHGIKRSEINALQERALAIDKELKSKRSDGSLPFFDLPYQDIEDIIRTANEIKDGFENFVLIGIGGSSLGPKALHSALNSPFYNQLTKKKRTGCPKIYFIENIDPDGLSALFEIIDIKKTVFNVITKSGSTAETMSNFLIVRERLNAEFEKREARRHIIATTDPKKGALRRIVEKEGYKSLEVPEKVGGRFAVFTSVGLLPAAVVGIDIKQLLEGAAYMDRLTRTDDIWGNPAYMKAVLEYIAAAEKGKNITVIMSYADALSVVGEWFCQLWAESLGKRMTIDKKVVNAGQTPVRALGTNDQHSQIQLYMEGPFDKTVTFIRVDKFKNEVLLPRISEDSDDLSYLGGLTMNELMHAEGFATELALTKEGRPNCRITLSEISPFTIGALLYMFEVQTAFAGGLYNVNPFDQPGVEEGKRMTYAMMGRPGYEEKKKEIHKTAKMTRLTIP